jgi:tetratricopeptide (TPR) repeat protein
MHRPPIKHNPAFLADADLARAFVVRHDDLALIVRVVRDNNSDSNQHILVTGPRGIGKTMLVHRVALGVQEDDGLRQSWYPLLFAEESYEVGSAGEFWLEALFHLARQTGDEAWQRAYNELKREPVEDRLRERALAQLMDFADRQGKRLLLVVENLNQILGDQISDDDAWKLRHTLMHEPRLMLLATATTHLDLAENTHKAMFEMFKTHALQPLNDEECQAVWHSVTGSDLGPRRIRAVSILTGGNPRLLAIISHFGARLSFAELMAGMTGMVDEHTDYFKSHLDALPPTERKAYVALADLWDPVTAREVAAASRLDVSKVSSLLGRLVGRGAVVEAPGKGRTKRYQVAERMYNIYYLMRRRGSPSERVRAVVQFMVRFYEEKELVEVTRRLAEEACGLSPQERQHHYRTFEEIVHAASPELRSRILACTPRHFLVAPDRPESFRQWLSETGEGQTCPCCLPGTADKRVSQLMREGQEALDKREWRKAEEIFRQATGIDAAYPTAWGMLGEALARQPQRADEAEQALRAAANAAPSYPHAWLVLAYHLARDSTRRAEAERCVRKAIEVCPDCSDAWLELARQLRHDPARAAEVARAWAEAEAACLRRTQREPQRAHAWLPLAAVRHRYTRRMAEAEDAYRRALDLNPKDPQAWTQFGSLLDGELSRYGEAEDAYRKAIGLDPDCASALLGLARLLREHRARYDEAEALLRKVIEAGRDDVDRALMELGELLERVGRYDEALATWQRAAEHNPKHACPWVRLGSLLYCRLGRRGDAEAAYRKAIEIDPRDAFAWTGLARLLGDVPGRPVEAEAAYRKAIEIAPKYAFAWTGLARLLGDVLARPAEADAAYRKAIEISPKDAWVWEGAVQLTLASLHEPRRALELAEQALAATPGDARCLNGLAWAFYESGPPEYLSHAESWARKAVALGDRFACLHTLACILARIGKVPEALTCAGRLLDDAEFVGGSVSHMVTLFAETVAAGGAEGALKALLGSKSATALEPVAVALKLHLGAEVHIAPEIAQVAKDVLRRFEELCQRRAQERAG